MNIQICNLEKRFNSNVILDKVSYLFKTGEVTVILGESGSGKTTLLNIIALFLDADNGEVLFDNVNLVNESRKNQLNFIRKNIGYVYQDIRIFEEVTAYDNLKIGLIFSSVNKSAYDVKIKEMLQLLDMEDKVNIKAGLLSGGEKQRLAIGRALIANKKIVLMDEPTGALDQKTTYNIIDLIRKINKELTTTIIIITHSQVVASCFSTNVEISEGKLHEK